MYTPPLTLAGYKDSSIAKTTRRDVIYALGLSPLNDKRLWAGTDDVPIWTTADAGGHWMNVTPPEMKPFWKFFNMDARHFDAGTAYAAVNTLRLDDMRRHLFRTHVVVYSLPRLGGRRLSSWRLDEVFVTGIVPEKFITPGGIERVAHRYVFAWACAIQQIQLGGGCLKKMGPRDQPQAAGSKVDMQHGSSNRV